MAQKKDKRRSVKGHRHLSICLLVVTLLSLLLSACGGPAAQPQAEGDKDALDNQIAHARDIGVPVATLQPIIDQALLLEQSRAPFTLFYNQPAQDHYSNLALSYQMLTLQVSSLEQKTTEELRYQASQEMQEFEQILAQRKAQGFVQATKFSEMYNQYEEDLKNSALPKDFATIKDNAWDGAESMRLLGTAFDKLTLLQSVSTQFKSSNISTATVDQQYNLAVERLREASTSTEYTTIIAQLDAYTQETTTISMQAAPIVGQAKLDQLSKQIDRMKQYEGDASSFEQRLEKNRQALEKARTFKEYMEFSTQIDKDLADIRLPAIQAETYFRANDYHEQVASWSSSHIYHNPYDGKDYQLGHEYSAIEGGVYGAGTDINNALYLAEVTGTVESYQDAINTTKNLMANFKAMQENSTDSTPWNQPHAADFSLMEHYQVSDMSVVVSLSEQAVRVYQGHNLLRSIPVVTGKYQRPTPAGFWTIWTRKSPAKFVSGDPKGSPEYFEPTDIKYAVLFTVWEHYFHDTDWRTIYGNSNGVRVNLPHDELIPSSRDGSHGCVNMPEADVAWIYNNIPNSTPVIIY